MDEFILHAGCRDFFPKFLHVTVYGAIADDPSIRVNPVHELLAVENSAWIGCQILEKFELYSRKIKVPAIECAAIAGFVENKSCCLDHVCPASPSQYGLDPGNHLTRAERLADVIVGTEFKPEQAV